MTLHIGPTTALIVCCDVMSSSSFCEQYQVRKSALRPQSGNEVIISTHTHPGHVSTPGGEAASDTVLSAQWKIIWTKVQNQQDHSASYVLLIGRQY